MIKVVKHIEADDGAFSVSDTCEKNYDAIVLNNFSSRRSWTLLMALEGEWTALYLIAFMLHCV